MMKLMKRLVVGVAVVGLMLSFPVPAMAQVCQPTDVDCVEPPPQDPCAIPLQQGNASQGALEYADPSTDPSADGSEFTFEPTVSPTCDQIVPQDQGGGGGWTADEIDYGGGGNSDDPYAPLDVR